MPLLGIDCRFGSVYGGLGTYTRSLVRALVRQPQLPETVFFVSHIGEPWLRDLPKGRLRLIEAPFPHYSLAEQTAFPNLLQDAKCDLLLFPHFNVPLVCPTPFLCTVHDLILHRFPNEAPLMKRLAYRFVLSRALSRARKIMTVSSFTKDDIAATYGSRIGHKTVVAYPGVDATFSPATDEAKEDVCTKYGLRAPFLLYIGNAKEHKNVPLLVDAFAQSGLQGVELVLLTAGREVAGLRRTAGVKILGNVPEQELPALLSSSLACVTATSMEGFCLPLLEAMACGTPVVATETGPIPEVTAGFARLCEPTTVSVSDGLRAAVLQKPEKSTLEAARAHAAMFTWDRTASTVLAAVLDVLTEG